MAFSFFGGVHPKENKWYACDKETQVFPAPDIVVIPMSQHIGAPCKPLVKKGDLVTVGQKIGDNQGLCVPVHASVSGKVKAVEARAHTSGTTVMSVVIENDHLDTLCPDIHKRTQEQVDALSVEELIDIIHEGGIVGMGGATFPTHVKLSGGIGKVDTVIINAGECEPYITADDRLCREHPAELISGLKIIMKIFGLKEGHIGIEDNKPDAVESMRKACEKYGEFSVTALKTKYPQGGEKQLIDAILHKQVANGALPVSTGAIVQNVGTAFAVYEAVQKNKPLVERIVTVTGDGVKQPGNYRIRLGMPIRELIEIAGGLPSDSAKVILGGPMMGKAVSNLDAPIPKGCSGILILNEVHAHRSETSSCIRCGKCVSACPMGLEPYLLAKLSENHLFERAEKELITACLECGCCAYSCPSNRPILDYIRIGKNAVNQIIRSRKQS